MKQAVQTLALVIAAGSLIACGGGTKSSPNPTPTLPSVDLAYQGYWNAPGYGTVLDISEDTVTLYKYTSDYCILQDQFDNVTTSVLERSVELQSSSNQLNWFAGYGTKTFGAPGMLLDKVSALPASCSSDVLSPGSSMSNADLFALYSQIMKEYYVDFSRNNVDWDTLSYNQSLTITQQASSLLEAVYQTFVPLADGHNSWQSAQGQTVQVLGKPTHYMRLIEEYAVAHGLSYPLVENELDNATINAINLYVEAQLELEMEIMASYATTDIESAADERVFWTSINNIGYLRIDAMTGYSTAANSTDDLTRVTSALDNINAILDEALTALSDTQGMIIDIRGNGGGNDYISLAIASRFTDSAFTAYKKYARDGSGYTAVREVTVSPSENVTYTNKPVVLLVSTNTASAAEVFAMTLSQLDQVSVVGEPTQGIFSDILSWVLPGEHELGLSNEVYLTADDEWLEGEGVAVDIQQAYFNLSDRQQQKDSGIEKALELLQ